MEISEEWLRKIITDAVREALRLAIMDIQEQLSVLQKEYVSLLSASEHRIDKTNKMIRELSATVKKLQEFMNTISNTYESHIKDLEKARDEMAEANRQLSDNNAEIIKGNVNLTELIRTVENNLQSIIDGQRIELQSAKVMYNDMKALAEGLSKTSININK